MGRTVLGKDRFVLACIPSNISCVSSRGPSSCPLFDTAKLSWPGNLSESIISNFQNGFNLNYKYHRIIFLHVSKTGGRAFEEFTLGLPHVKLTKQPETLDYMRSKMPSENVEVVTYHVNSKSSAQDLIATLTDYKRELAMRGVALWLTMAFRKPIDHFISQFRWHLKMFTRQPKRFGVVGNRLRCQYYFLSTLLNFLYTYPCGGFSPQSSWLLDFMDGILWQQTDFMLFEKKDVLLKLFHMIDFPFIFENFTDDLRFFLSKGLSMNNSHFVQRLPWKNINGGKFAEVRTGKELQAKCPLARHEIGNRIRFDEQIYSDLSKAEQFLRNEFRFASAR